MSKIIGAILLAPFLIPIGVFFFIGAWILLIVGFPIILGLSLVYRENIFEFYYFCLTEMTIFPFKILLGYE